MNMKDHILMALREQFGCWQNLLATMSEAQITTVQRPSDWSTKDTIAHLWAWQQRSIARLDAARLDREPVFPIWPAAANPDAEGSTDLTNAWIHATYRHLPWEAVHRQWREGFLQFLDLGEAIPERDLMDAQRYPWLAGPPLALILIASYDHHREHLEGLLAWLGRQVKQ